MNANQPVRPLPTPGRPDNAAWWTRRAGWVLLLAGILPVMGCRSSRAAFYPVGIYTSGAGTNDYAVLRAAGFNVVTAGLDDPATTAAIRQAGLRVLLSPGTTAGPAFDPAAARRTVARHDANPLVWAWYLSDEPDLNNIAPELVRDAHRAVKAVPARRPTALVLQDGAEAQHYGRIPDILMLDRYPVPWQPLATFGQHVRMARLGAGPDRPLIAVIQAFDWSRYPTMIEVKPDFRPPTREEIRCMTYLALVEGANGLFYYTFADGNWKIREHPETWDALRQVVGEVNQRLPLFQAEHLWWPWRNVIKYRSPDRFGPVYDSSVVMAWVRVTRGDAATPAGTYIIAVNTTEKPQSLRWFLPLAAVRPVRVAGEDRALTPAENWITDDFAPYGVHVYGPLE